MQAIVIDSYGSADQLTLREIERPSPGPHEILVRVHAASINPIDWKIRRGDFRLLVSRTFPKVLGVDFAGTVEQVGSSMRKGPKVGDSVFGMCHPLRAQFGSYGQYAIVEVDAFAIKPEAVSFSDAASIPVAGLTSLKALRDLIRLKAGQHLLINGASGGVGMFAVQLAKLFGAQVTATCSANNLEFVRSLGADSVLDYAVDDVLKLNGKFHGIFDAAAKLSFGQVKHLLTKDGVYVTSVPDRTSILDSIFTSIIPGKKSKMVLAGTGSGVPKDLSELANMVATGQIRPVISKTFPLSELPEVHAAAEQGHNRGKLVVEIP